MKANAPNLFAAARAGAPGTATAAAQTNSGPVTPAPADATSSGGGGAGVDDEKARGGANGVILAQTGRFGSGSLYLKGGKPTYTYNSLGLQSFTNKALSD
jgi:hypothetical protein